MIMNIAALGESVKKSVKLGGRGGPFDGFEAGRKIGRGEGERQQPS